MKRGTKIALIVLAVILAAGIAVFVGADVFVSRLAQNQVNQALSGLTDCEASCGTIHVRLFSGTAEVDDLHFAYRGEQLSRRDTMRPGIEAHVDRVVVGHLFYSLLLKHRVLLSDLRIIRPKVELWMDDKNPQNCFPKFEMPQPDSTANKEMWLKQAELMHFHLKNASLRFHSLRSKLDVAVDSCSLTLHDLAYDSVFTYNDSTYRFSLGHASVILPDGRIQIETHDFSQKNQGALTIGNTRIRHTMNRKKLADIVKEPSTWMDIRIDRVTTSAFNPVRKALAKDYTLESVKVVLGKMDIYRDTRYAPKKPFPMPQEAFLDIPVPFSVNRVNAIIKRIDVELASTDIAKGELQLRDINATVENITNRRNATMRISGSCPVEGGEAQAKIGLKMNKACEFSTKLHATDINGEFLNTFLRPLVGMTMKCQIDTLDTEYTGDKIKATGDFRMLYHGFEAQFYQDEKVPYEVISKNAKTLTSVANTLLPKSNPTPVDISPRGYQVEWNNDPWKPFPLYLFGPCIDGAKKTFLPGLYVHKQKRDTKKAKR